MGTAFGSKTFGNFTELRYFTNVKSLAALAFNGARSGKLVIPEHITGFSSSCFRFSKCDLLDLPFGIATIPNYSQNITVLIVRAVTPPTLTVYSNFNSATNIYVPDGSVDAYKTASSWTRFASKISPLSEYTDQ